VITLVEMAQETRKVQLTGKSTYIVSLPKGWVKGMGLRAGSQLAISRQSDASLLLTPLELVKTTKLGEASITVTKGEDPNTIIRKIVALYLIGYNFIRINTKDERITSPHRNFIKDLTRRKLVGTEIITDSPNEMKLQILLSYPELSVESALRRMHLIASSMHGDAIKALEGLDKELAKDVIPLDDEVDRFNFYIIRQLKAAVQSESILRDIGLSNPKDCLGYRLIVKSVERIADHAVKIAENVLLLNHLIDNSTVKKISEMSAFARSVFDDSMKSLYSKDYLLADNAVAKSKTIATMEDDLMKVIGKRMDAADMSHKDDLGEHS
jgi:phosphate uptake regulator